MNNPIVQRFLNPPFSQSQSIFATSPPTVYPTTYGADPTGKQDSTKAFKAALAHLFTMGSNHSLADGVRDLGGATLDLGGGDYLVSAPLVIPQFYGNLRIVRGTIRASSSFPKNEYVISVGSGECTNQQKSCNENVGFENLMIDASRVAAGCISISTTMGSVIGPECFFLGFREAGVSFFGGHEGMISHSWFGEFLYGDPRSHDASFLTATAIQVFGPDHFVTDSIVFSALVGMEITEGANLIKGVHTWNLASKHGGIGIIVNHQFNRILNCYLDYNSIVAIDPQSTTITDGFFLCGGNIVLKAGPQKKIQGLTIRNNQFANCENESIILDERENKFTDVKDVVIDGNMVTEGYTIKSNQARASLTLSNTTHFDFDFSDRLLFDSINTVEYSLVLEGTSFVRHAARMPVGKTVRIETDVECSGTVNVFVDQNVPSHPCNGKCKKK